MKRPLLLLAIFVIAFLLRAAAIVASGAAEIGFGDARDYLATARAICVEGDYPDRGNLPFFRAPGLPFFLASVTGCQPDRVAPAKLALALVDALLAPLLYVLAVALTGSPLAGLLAAAGGALHPGLIWQTTDIRSEPLFTVMLTASLASFALARGVARRWLFLAAGATAAMAALARPVGLAAIAFFVVAILVGGVGANPDASRAGRAPRRAGAAALVLAGALLALAPWSGFMAAKHGELIVVNDAGGYNLWRGTHPGLRDALTASTADAYRERARAFELEISPREAAAVDAAASTPMARSRAWRARAVAIMRRDPGGFARYTLWKAADFWQPSLNRFEYPRRVVWGSAAFNLALYALALGGIALLWRGHRDSAVLLLAWIVTFWLAHVPFQVVSRFRTASLEPVLLVLAATAVAAWARRGEPAAGS